MADARVARAWGGAGQVEKDVDTVFQSEAPAMTNWRFGPEEGARITQPIIYLTGGGRHGASRERMQMWIKGMEQFVIPNTTHAMLMEDPRGVADAVAAFLKQHPLK